MSSLWGCQHLGREGVWIATRDCGGSGGEGGLMN